MINCPNCNQGNADGSKFCANCGTKLEVFVTCPGCGAQVSTTASFCSNCGANLKQGGNSKGMLSDAVVAGDIGNIDNSIDNSVSTIITNNTTNNSTTNNFDNSVNITNVYNNSLIKCHACDKSMAEGSKEVHKCIKCGNSYCDEHFNTNLMICEDCLKRAVDALCSGGFGEARAIFEAAIAAGGNNPALYYYAGISLLGGKRPFVHQRATVDKIVQYVNKAIQIDPQDASYYYLLAYVAYDFYARKFINIKPDYKTCLKLAISCGITEKQKNDIFSLLNVDRPSCL